MSKTVEILKKDGKYAFFEGDVRISDWFDEAVEFVSNTGFLDVVQVRNSAGKYSFFNRSGRQITDWYDSVAFGTFTPEFICVVSSNQGKAVLNVTKGSKGPWFSSISINGVLCGKSKFYIAGDANQLQAIFDIDGRQISKWWKFVSSDGLVNGQSNYYIAQDAKSNKMAVFDMEGNQISDWHSIVDPVGLVSGKSEFYKVFDKEDYAWKIYKGREKIVDGCAEIYNDGLLLGQSEFAVVQLKNKRHCLIDSSGHILLNRFRYIKPDGFVLGRSSLLQVSNDNGLSSLFDMSSYSLVTGWWKSINAQQALSGTSDLYTVVDNRNKIAIMDLFGVQHGHWCDVIYDYTKLWFSSSIAYIGMEGSSYCVGYGYGPNVSIKYFKSYKVAKNYYKEVTTPPSHVEVI